LVEPYQQLAAAVSAVFSATPEAAPLQRTIYETRSRQNKGRTSVNRKRMLTESESDSLFALVIHFMD
jgi:hypothetical protein